MTVNLSIKNVPEDLAQALRDRAHRNRRSLQRELLCVLEEAARLPEGKGMCDSPPPGTISIEEAAARSRKIFPNGTDSSIDYIRQVRDNP